MPGFPNCFVLYGPNTNLGHNSILFMVERQLNLVLQSLAAPGRVRRRPGSVGSVEVTPEAYDRDDARVQGRAGGTVWLDSCRSWYKNGRRPAHQQLAGLHGRLLGPRRCASTAGDLPVTAPRATDAEPAPGRR